MKHALIFGGTGMLAEMSEWLIKNMGYTIIFGRNEQRLRQLKARNEQRNVQMISLDYKNIGALKSAIHQAIEQQGPIAIVIAWIHSTAPLAIPTILEEISCRQTEQWRFVHVKGSTQNLSAIQEKIIAPDNCLYRDVQLGFKLEGSSSRWLTDREISNGVIDAIKHDREKAVIGTLKPWEKRP